MIHITVFVLTLCFGLGQEIDDLIVPRKSNIFITLERTISTQAAQPNDKFYARIAVPVTSKDRIVIPVGSYVIGHVQSIRRPGYLKGKGELTLAFDSIVFPEGITRNIEAVVQSSENYRTNNTQEEGELEAPGSQGKETVAGATRGAVAGIAIGGISGRSLKGAGLGAAIGTGVGAVLGLFRKGDDVVLRKGTSLTIQLKTDIHFVKPTPRQRGISLQPRK